MIGPSGLLLVVVASLHLSFSSYLGYGSGSEIESSWMWKDPNGGANGIEQVEDALSERTFERKGNIWRPSLRLKCLL